MILRGRHSSSVIAGVRGRKLEGIPHAILATFLMREPLFLFPNIKPKENLKEYL